MNRRHLWQIALFISSFVSGVHAQTTTTEGARLEYARSDHAASCPDQDALKAAVAQRLGYDPFLPAARRTVVVEVTDVEGGLRGQMRLVDAQGIIRGARELSERPEHCDELVAALALAISIALDPSSTPVALAPLDAVPTPKPDAADVEPAAPSITPSAPRAAPPVHELLAAPTPTMNAEGLARIAVRASGFGALGAAPEPAFGVRFGGSVSWPSFRVIVELSDQRATNKRLDGVGSVRLSRLAVSFAPCFARHDFAACAVLDIGSLHAEGTEILDGGERRLLDVLLGAEVEYAPRLVSHLKLVVDLGAGRPLDRTNFHVHGIAVWRTPAVFGSGALGLAWEF